ncbi:MAG: amidohydrolase, partial [Planctomycetota bacterium]
MTYRACRGFLVSILVLLAAGCDSESVEPADSVFVNGAIYVGKSETPWVSDVAIADGRFVYVGEDASIFIGPETSVYDLDGRMTIPGLIDGHTHIGLVGLSHDLVELPDVSSKPELFEAIRQMVREDPSNDYIIGGYWPNELFEESGPDKRDLDSIDDSRPIILYDWLTHSVWANSRALEQAGVNRDTPDITPDFSFYKKGDDGEPTGWITESASSVFINNFHSVTPDVVDAMLEYMHYFRTQGVTTLLDAGNFGMDEDVYAAISKLDKEDRLPVRFHGSYTLFKPDDLESAVATLQDLARKFNSENVRIDTLKVFYDGVVDTRTAGMMEDYLDTPGNSGEILLSQAQVHDLIIELEAAGLNLHVHSVGDRATHTLLNAVDDARKTLGRPQSIRITICHVEFVIDSDFNRFKDLDVVANFTPHWAVGGDLSWFEAGVGDLASRMQRSQPLLKDGARVSFSSDNTTESEWKGERKASSPFTGMQVGHMRQDIGMSASDPILPPAAERLKLDDLLNGYTTDAAYQLGRSDIGTIAIGKQGDLVVLNQNIF